MLRTFLVTSVCLSVLFCVLSARDSIAQQSPDYRSMRLDFSRAELQILAVGAALTLSAASTESPELAANSLDRLALIEGPMDFGNAYGSTWTMLGITAGLGSIGYLADNPRMTGAAVDLSKSLLLTGVVVAVLKNTVNRTRPDGMGLSFPSGHTAVAFTAAPVFERYFGWKAGVLAYSLATFTALARMEDSRHYFSDVIAGATIGILAGRAFTGRSGKVSVFGSAHRGGLLYEF